MYGDVCDKQIFTFSQKLLLQVGLITIYLTIPTEYITNRL